MTDPVPTPDALLRHAGFLRSLALGLLGEEAAAEDIVQETFVRALQSPPRTRDNLRGWLGKVARNLALMRRRGEGRRQVRERASVTHRRAPAPDEVAARLELQTDVARAVHSLEEPYRTAVYLRHFEDLKPREIARRLDIAPSTVHTRLQRAYGFLREQLDARHGRKMWSMALAALFLPSKEAAAAAVGVALVSSRIKMSLLAVLLVLGTGAVWHLSQRETSKPVRATARTAPPVIAPAPDRVGEGPVLEKEELPVRSPWEKLEGPHITGKVLDPDGRPVANARVLVFASNTSEPRRPATDERAVRTDAQGRFAAPLGGQAPFWTAFASASGFGPARRRGLQPDADIVLALTATQEQFGLVMNMQRQPVPGARVRWVAVFDGLVIEREVRSDARGRYELRGLPSPEEFEYRPGSRNPLAYVRAEDYAPLVAELGKPDGERHLVLGRGMKLTINVVTEDGKPVPNARVAIRMVGRRPMRRYPDAGPVPSPHHLVELAVEKTDSKGIAAFPHAPAIGLHDHEVPSGLRPGGMQFVLDVRAEGFVHSTPTASYGAEGSTRTETVTLKKAGQLFGRVVDGQRRPVTNTRVTAYPVGREFFRQYRRDWPEGQTDDDGRFRIAGLPQGLTTLTIHRPEEAVGQRVNAWDAGEITIGPPKVATASFLVVDESGTPIADAVISYGQRTDARGRARKNYRTTVATREEVRARGFAVARTDEFTPAAVDAPEVRVVLSKGTTVSGTVTWMDGTPAKGTWVSVFDGRLDPKVAFGRRVPPGGSYGMGEVGTDGRYQVDDVLPGPYHIRANWYEFPGTGAYADVQATRQHNVDLVLPRPYEALPTAAIVGTLLDKQSGKRIPLAQLTCRSKRRWFTPRFLEPGRFRYRPLPVGEYVIKVRAPGYPLSPPFHVKVERPDQVVDVALTLSVGSDIRGTIRSNDKEVSLEGVRFFFAPVGDSATGPSVVVGKAGLYHAKQAAPGRYMPRVFARPPLAVAGFPTIEVVEGGATAVLDFEVVKAGTLVFKKARMEVELRDLDGNVLERRKRAFGAWNVPPGRYKLVAGDWSREVTVEVATTVTLE